MKAQEDRLNLVNFKLTPSGLQASFEAEGGRY